MAQPPDPPTSPDPARNPWRVPRPGRGAALAVAAGLIYAFCLYAWAKWLHPHSSLVVASFLLGAPLASCAAAVALDDPRGTAGDGRHVSLSVGVISAIIAASFLVLKEGGICMLMASPLFYALGVLGGFVGGRLMEGRGGRALCVVIVIAPLVGLPAEGPELYPRTTEEVTTTLEIAAPPAAVWRNTTAIPAIAQAERIATFSHDLVGVPRPVAARLDGHGPGAVRQLTWTGGVHFQEIVTGWDQDRALAWRFHFAPDSVPLAIERNINVQSPYLWIRDGDYRLDPLPGGRTRLTLHTRYELATPINGYCAWWGGVFFNDFHRAVLHVIKLRAEREAAAAT